MMRVVSRVDGAAEGLYVEDVLLEDGAPLPQGCVESRPPGGFYAPKWTGSEWVEGKPASEIVEALKAEKIAQMHAAAISELTPLFTEGLGRDELVFLLAAHVRSIAGPQADPRLAEVERVGSKALAKKEAMEAASSEEELEEISWTA
jgi:hypothetical protein